MRNIRNIIPLLFCGCASKWTESTIKLRDNPYENSRAIATEIFGKIRNKEFQEILKHSSPGLINKIDSVGVNNYFSLYYDELKALKNQKMLEGVYYISDTTCPGWNEVSDINLEKDKCSKTVYEFYFILGIINNACRKTLKLHIHRESGLIKKIQVEKACRYR